MTAPGPAEPVVAPPFSPAEFSEFTRRLIRRDEAGVNEWVAQRVHTEFEAAFLLHTVASSAGRIARAAHPVVAEAIDAGGTVVLSVREGADGAEAAAARTFTAAMQNDREAITAHVLAAIKLGAEWVTEVLDALCALYLEALGEAHLGGSDV